MITIHSQKYGDLKIPLDGHLEYNSAGPYPNAEQLSIFNFVYQGRVVGLGILNRSEDFFFHNGIKVENVAFVPYPGTRALTYIPDDPTHYRVSPKVPGSDKAHFIAPGEIIPILYDHSLFAPPIDAQKNAITKIIGQIFDTSILAERRIEKILDGHSAKQEEGNLDWLMANYHIRNGGEPRVGWYKRLTCRSGSGDNNWHYYKIAWMFFNYFFEGPTPEPDATWTLALAASINHACQGRLHIGPQAGMAHVEKNENFYGDNKPPLWEKQYGWNLFAPYAYTLGTPMNAIFKPFVDEYINLLMNVNVKTIYQGAWGIRIARYAAEDLLAAYLITPNLQQKERLKSQLEGLLNDAYSHFGENYWENSGNSEVESPWMQFGMHGLMFRAFQLIPNLNVRYDIEWVMKAFEWMYENGMVDFEIKKFDGKIRVCKYRIGPDVIDNCDLHRNGLVYTAFKFAAQHDPIKWRKLFYDFKEKLCYFAGSPLWAISPEFEQLKEPGKYEREGPGNDYDAWPIDEIKYDFPPEGNSAEKSWSLYLMMSL